MPPRQIAVLFQRSTAAATERSAVSSFDGIELGLRQSARTKFVKGVARSPSDGGGNGRPAVAAGRLNWRIKPRQQGARSAFFLVNRKIFRDDARSSRNRRAFTRTRRGAPGDPLKFQVS